VAERAYPDRNDIKRDNRAWNVPTQPVRQSPFPRQCGGGRTIPGNKVFMRLAFHQAAGFATGPEFRTEFRGEDGPLIQCLSTIGPSLEIQQPLYNLRVDEGDHFWRFIGFTDIAEDGTVIFSDVS